MDKTGLELGATYFCVNIMNSKQQLKGKLVKWHILTFGFCCNSGSVNLFFFKSRGRDLSRPFKLGLSTQKLARPCILKEGTKKKKKKPQYNKIQKKLYFERGVRDDPYGPFIKIFKLANMKIQHYKGCA